MSRPHEAADALAGEGDGYPAPIMNVNDICELQTLARNLGYMVKKRWPSKDHDVSDEWVNANIGHAAAAAKHALPSLNRVIGALADAAWAAGQRSKEAAPAPIAAQGRQGPVVDDALNALRNMVLHMQEYKPTAQKNSSVRKGFVAFMGKARATEEGEPGNYVRTADVLDAIDAALAHSPQDGES